MVKPRVANRADLLKRNEPGHRTRLSPEALIVPSMIDAMSDVADGGGINLFRLSRPDAVHALLQGGLDRAICPRPDRETPS